MRLSIVIPAWIMNEELLGYAKVCIDSIKKHTQDYELIIVDNGSELGQEYLREMADVYVRNKTNLGFAPAVNQGYRLAKGDYIAIMNDDIVVGEKWADNLIKVAVLGSVGSPAFLQKEQWKAEMQWDENINQVQRDKNWRGGAEDIELLPELDGWGALFVASKAMFKSVELPDGSLMDETFKMGMYEDRDLWLRFMLKGIRCARNHQCWVYHVGNASWGKLPDQEKIFFKNKEIYDERVQRLWYNRDNEAR